MMSRIEDSVGVFLLHSGSTIRDTLERLQVTAKGAVILVDGDGCLVRLVTDGDVRRLLLAGHGMGDSLHTLPKQEPMVASADMEPDQALSIMNRHRVDHLPMVDANGRPVKLFARRDLDTTILLSTPHIGANEMKYVEEAFRTNWIAPLGPNVDAFEREIALYAGCAGAAAVSSGTAAIHLGLRLLDVGPGDMVFCSSMTFVASVNPILYQGATPVLIDSEPMTWNMSPAALKRAFQDAASAGALPKAVIVVNLYGQSADYDPIIELCDVYGVPILEDAAESLGATYKGRYSGTLGKIGVFSFNGNKIITTSGGGMLVSDDLALTARARHLSTQARENVAHYEHTEVGYNYRMSNVLAGIGRGQLGVLENRVAARRAVFHRYVRALEDVPSIEWMPESNKGRSTHWLSACTLRGELGAVETIARLAEERIEARRLWKPMHLQPLFKGVRYYPHAEDQDVSADLFERGICLPSGSNMTEEQQERIAATLRRVLLS
jgi:dTDP-4-amino-4,6-dideoxygalactose transaminase